MVAVEERNGDGGTGWVLALPASEGGSYGRRARTSQVLSSPADSISGRRQASGAVRRPRGGWTPEEDAKLRKAVSAFEGKNWKNIAESFPDRTEAQCLHRWQKVLDPQLLKGPWTKEEDETIIDMVKEHGPRKWSDIAKSLRGRTGKQCRERWHNSLNPQLRKGSWTIEEERLLINAHRLLGNKWADIAKILPGRTDNAVKNHWNSSVRKRLKHYNRSVTRNDLKHAANRPPAENHIDLNKEPSINLQDCSVVVDRSHPTQSPRVCSLENIKGCSNFLSPSMPVARPVTLCGALVPDDSAVALALMRLKMDSGHDQDRGLKFVSEKGLEINLPNEKGPEIDRITDKMGPSGLAKSGERGNIGCESPSQNEARPFGSLRYQIPMLDDTGLARSPAFSTHHGVAFQSLTGYTAPSPTDGKKSDLPSVDSILKSAAENFPNTPSILRRRKRKKPAPARDCELRNDTNNGSFDTPMGNSNADGPNSFKNSTSLSDVLGKSDVSPSYRPRSKSMAVLKTIEEHLDFSSDAMDISDTYGVWKPACRSSEIINSSTDISSLQNKKIGGHMIGLETSTDDFVHTTKLDAT